MRYIFGILVFSSLAHGLCTSPVSKDKANCIAEAFLRYRMTHPYPCFFPGACALGARDLREQIEEECSFSPSVVVKLRKDLSEAKANCDTALAYCTGKSEWFVLDHLSSDKPLPYGEWDSQCHAPDANNSCRLTTDLGLTLNLRLVETRYRCYGRLARQLKKCEGDSQCETEARSACDCCEQNCDLRRRKTADTSLTVPKVLGLSCRTLSLQPGFCPQLERRK